ncbi:MAG: hypothetical protein ACSLEN_05850 [Candidatus Malihini olakiniferum]
MQPVTVWDAIRPRCACCLLSKTKPKSNLRMAYAAGYRMLSENKVQEALGKWEEIRI